MSVSAIKKYLRERAALSDRARRIVEWLLLLLSSITLVAVMRAAQLPAALMLGPMITAIGFALGGAKARLPRTFALGAQTVLGCLIAKAFNSGLLSVLAAHWPTLIGLSTATLVMTAALGLLIAHRGWARWRELPSIPHGKRHPEGARRRIARQINVVRRIAVFGQCGEVRREVRKVHERALVGDVPRKQVDHEFFIDGPPAEVHVHEAV